MTRSQSYVTWTRSLLGFLAILFFLWACDEKIAGTSIDTGNPGKITLGFVEGASARKVSGEALLYENSQIPFIDSAPWVRYSFTAQDSLHIEGESLDSAWKTFSRSELSADDSILILRLNVRTSDSLGSSETLIRYNRLRKSFLPGSKTRILLTSFVTTEGKTKIQPSQEFRSYFYLSGTPYFSLSDSGKFLFPSVPKGNYQMSLLIVSKKAPVTGEKSLAEILVFADSLGVAQPPSGMFDSLISRDTINIPADWYDRQSH